MMGVFIKSMKMPYCCDKCGFGRWSSLHQTAACSIHNYDACFEDCSVDYRKKRSEFCPLIEVKEPHGRLGDLDKLKYDIVVGNQKYLGLNEPCLEDVTPIENVDDCIDAIAFAPSIIEAEGREE